MTLDLCGSCFNPDGREERSVKINVSLLGICTPVILTEFLVDVFQNDLSFPIVANRLVEKACFRYSVGQYSFKIAASISNKCLRICSCHSL